MKQRIPTHAGPRPFGVVLAVATAMLLAVLPGEGLGQEIEQPIAPVGVFAALPAGSGGGLVSQLSDPSPSIEGSPIGCTKTEGKQTRPTGICAVEIALNDPSGEIIGLSAAPAGGSEFVGWVVYPDDTPTHRCGVEPVCYVLMGDEVAAVAVFNLSIRPPASPPRVPLTVTRQGHDAESGSVTSNPTGITCVPGASSCSTSFPVGTSVTLTATAGPSGSFAGWGGACTGAGASSTCTLTIGSSTVVSASFDIATQQLSVAIQGPSNSGSVTSDVQPGLVCPDTCTAAFAQNSQVTLMGAAITGFRFTGWTGAGCSGTAACVVAIGTQAQSVTATFEALTVNAVLRSARVVRTGRNYKTRQVQALVRSNELVNVLIRVRRGNVTIAQRVYKQFGPDSALAAFNLRSSVRPGRAQVQATFVNAAGIEKVQTRNVTIPK